VRQALFENIAYVAVVERVKDRLAILSVFDETRLPERAKLVGNGGFGHSKKNRYVAHAHLGVLQRGENPHPSGIPEHLEQIRQVHQKLFVGHLGTHIRHHILMDCIAVASIGIGCSFSHNASSLKTIEHMNNYTSYFSIRQYLRGLWDKTRRKQCIIDGRPAHTEEGAL
jgi:hypothetical protein